MSLDITSFSNLFIVTKASCLAKLYTNLTNSDFLTMFTGKTAILCGGLVNVACPAI